MKTLLAVVGVIVGYFIGSFFLRLLSAVGMDIASMALIFGFIPYLTALALAIILPAVYSRNKKQH